jgi:hypothetical protein
MVRSFAKTRNMKKKILVLGTSTASIYIKSYWGDRAEVIVLGRKTTPIFDMLDNNSWPSLECLSSFDEIHYTTHANIGTAQIPIMTELLKHLSIANVNLIVWSSMWGSITHTTDSMWYWLPYKIVKVAMNMTCKVLAYQKETNAKILLIHPGSYASRMNAKSDINGEQIVHTALSNIENWDGKFMFMDGRNGNAIPY